MSRMVVGRLDIDVLVHLAVRGPIEAIEWRPLVDDPNGFGQRLWMCNVEVAAPDDEDDPVPQYLFTPIPVGVTATEGLKQIAFYRYQTMAEDPVWEDSGLPEVLERLQDALVDHVAGWHEAPWGWGPADLAARAGRDPNEPSEPEALTALRRRWSEAGMPLKQIRVMHPEFGHYDARIIASGGWWPFNQSGSSALYATLCVDAEAATAVFRDRARKAITYRKAGSHLYRYGDVVVLRTGGSPDEWVAEVERLLPRLGEPDEHWWGGAPPVASPDLEVLAADVRLDPKLAGRQHHRDAIVATTPGERSRLIAFVAEPAMRAAIEAVDMRSKSVVLIRGLSELESLEPAEVHPDPDGGLRLFLKADHASSMRGTILLCDRLPSDLGVVQVRAPEITFEAKAHKA